MANQMGRIQPAHLFGRLMVLIGDVNYAGWISHPMRILAVGFEIRIHYLECRIRRL